MVPYGVMALAFFGVIYRTGIYTLPCGLATIIHRTRMWTQPGLPGYTHGRVELEVTVSTPGPWGSTDLSDRQSIVRKKPN